MGQKVIKTAAKRERVGLGGYWRPGLEWGGQRVIDIHPEIANGQ